MFVPLLSMPRRTSPSRLSESTPDHRSLPRARDLKIRAGASGEGGGGEGGAAESSGGEGEGGSGSGEGEGNSGSGEGEGNGSSGEENESSPISIGGTTKSIGTYSKGGGKPTTISSGLFAGRTEGGGTRAQVWGTRTYGSGYPGLSSRGVAGRGFPFYFWPISWGSGTGYSSNASYLYSGEYGQPDNSSRPGGPMAAAAFQSNSSTFRLVADNDTVADLMPIITANCSQFLTSSNSATAPVAFNESGEKPEQVVQYYRASSAALTLDGYNNTAIFAPENSTADTALPSGVDTNLLDCLNSTIGPAVPLIDSATPAFSPPAMGVLALVFLLRAVL
ncbi:hypothetical protein DFH06DRAFT_1425900 [Mycena polygramma]|nr:hypothetical protein DFH06DRAFT_1425900 [Mycena polygramma]